MVHQRPAEEPRDSRFIKNKPFSRYTPTASRNRPTLGMFPIGIGKSKISLPLIEYHTDRAA